MLARLLCNDGQPMTAISVATEGLAVVLPESNVHNSLKLMLAQAQVDAGDEVGALETTRSLPDHNHMQKTHPIERQIRRLEP